MNNVVVVVPNEFVPIMQSRGYAPSRRNNLETTMWRRFIDDDAAMKEGRFLTSRKVYLWAVETA